MGSIYKRGNVWWGRCQVKGKDRRASLGTTSESEARAKLVAWQEEERRAGILNVVTWDSACLRYIKEIMPQSVKPSTATRYLYSFKNVHRYLTGKDMRAIGRPEVLEIANRPGVTVATRKRDLTAVNQVFRSAEAWGLIDINPFRAIDLGAILKERRDPITLPTDRDIDTFFEACHPTLEKMARLLLATGLRLEEAASLEWKHLKTERRVVVITGKGSKVRSVPLDEEAMSILQSCPRHISSPFVFWHGAAGDRYAHPNTRFYEIRKRAGVPFRTHDLRHLFAVRYLEKGGNIYRLQKILGHTNLKTTEDIYLKYIESEQQLTAKYG